MTDNTKMRDDAIREAARNHAMDEYFEARPHLMRTRHEECLFEAGFDRAWQAAQMECKHSDSVPEEKLDFEKLEALGWQIAVCAMCGTHASAIKSSTFGRTELSGLEAARFIRHMNEDAPKPEAKAAFARGRELLKKLKRAAIAQGKGE